MDNSPLTLTVPDDQAGTRLDRFIAGSVATLSRNQVQQLNTLGGVTVDGRSRPDSFALSGGETVVVTPSLITPAEGSAGEAPVPQDIPLAVVYEDDDIVVVNKQPGLVVHPAHGNRDGTLVNALLGRGSTLATIGAPERPGIVHRLDKDTSGLIVVARTDAAHQALAAAVAERRFHKTYHAIAHGSPARDRMEIDEPIARHPVKRQQMAVVPRSGKPARTEAFVVDRYSRFVYIRVITFTGRTHQIRVHLAHIGHPLLGDSLYGGRRERGRGGAGSGRVMSRHALHASRLSFEHPTTGRWMSFKTALPDDMRNVLEAIYNKDRIEEVSD